MSGRKAFTLVETVITISLICGAIILWTYILSAGRSQSYNMDSDQAFNHMRASFLYHLKKDMRSSTAIKQLSNRSWEIEKVEFSKSGLPEVTKTIYELNTASNIIFVFEGGKKKSYDFSKTLKGQKINFKIIP